MARRWRMRPVKRDTYRWRTYDGTTGLFEEKKVAEGVASTATAAQREALVPLSDAQVSTLRRVFRSEARSLWTTRSGRPAAVEIVRVRR